MELKVISERALLVLVSRSFFCLLMVALLPARETEDHRGSGRPVWNVDQSGGNGATWNAGNVAVKVGSSLSLSCHVDALDLRYEVLKVSLLQGEELLPLVENGNVHSPFSTISRYAARMNESPGNGFDVTINLNDIQPEDSGSFICHRHSGSDSSATLNVTVIVPVSDLYITSIYANDDELRVDPESDVFLQEHDYYGVGCIAATAGSITPPDVRIEIDGKDETDVFQSILQVEYSILPSGLTFWKSYLRLALVTSRPNPSFNEKVMRCVAAQSGFQEMETTARLIIQYSPQVRCFPERHLARIGTSVTFECTIKANPGSRIMWSSARGDLSSYPNVFFSETVVGADETRLTLSIRDVKPINYQKYTLTAANLVGSQNIVIELLRDDTVLAERHPDVETPTPPKEDLPRGLVEDVLQIDRFQPEKVTISPEVKTVEMTRVLPGTARDVVFAITSSSPAVRDTSPEDKRTSPEMRNTLTESSEINLFAGSSYMGTTRSSKQEIIPNLGNSTGHRNENDSSLETASSDEESGSSTEDHLPPSDPDQRLQESGIRYSDSRSSRKKYSGEAKSHTNSSSVGVRLTPLLLAVSVVVSML